MNKITLISLLLVAAVFAAESDSVLVEQRALLQNLQNMDESQPGVLLTGEFKSNVSSVMLNASEGGNENKSTEINAATEANIKIQARPTAETRATVLLRIHQDWQKSHEEGISPFLFHWISFDGKAWDKRIDFNLGDMRVAYTPLTIFMPSLGLENEPEIFAKRRRDIMEYSNLDGSDGRLLQGLNFSMHSGEASFLDNAYLQVTGSRLRAQAKKADQLALDIDNTDRFLIAGRGGVDLYGISLGGAYVYTFSREKAAENFVASAVMGLGVPYLLEDNGVGSATFGIDIAKLAGLDGWKFSLSGEYAASWYQTWLFELDQTAKEKVMETNTITIYVNGEPQEVNSITYKIADKKGVYKKTDNGSLEDKALHALLELSLPRSIADVSFKFRFVQNGKDFISELSQSPQYFATQILNASAINNFRGGTLENLYFADYSNDPLTQLSLLGQKSTFETSTLASSNNLYNNFKKAHFVRTGYTGNSLTPAERMAISPVFLDPGINLSMPWGLATPDRAGFLLNLEMALLDNKLSFNAKANMLTQDEAFIDGEKAPSYMDVGGGFSLEAGRFMGLQKPLTLQAGFEMSSESDGFKRSSQNTAAGLRWGIWRSISLVSGFSLVKKDYGTALGIPLEATELLLLAGPEVKLSEGAYFNAQYGMLNNEYKSETNTTKLDRNIITADVRVKF